MDQNPQDGGMPTTESVPVARPNVIQNQRVKHPKSRKFLIVLLLVAIVALILFALPSIRYAFNKVVLRRVSVQVLVEDKISGSAIADANVAYNGHIIKTGSDGSAIIYAQKNTLNAKVTVGAPNFSPSTETVYFNQSHKASVALDLLHTGSIYFLKQDSVYGVASADIVRSNLDGSNQKVILQGDGNELQQVNDSDGNTNYAGPSLLAARDWKHLAYLARNSGFVSTKGPEPKTSVRLYIVDTSNEKTVQIEMADKTPVAENNSIQLVGWLDDQHFVYTIFTASGQEQIKSYDTNTGKVTTLLANKQNQNFSAIYIVGGKLVFAETCAIDGPPDPSINEAKGLAACKKAGLQGRIISLSADGKITTLKQLDQSWLAGIVTNNIYGPNELYFTVYGTKSGVYHYLYNGQTVSDTTQDKAENQKYNPALSSPDGANVFWLKSAKNNTSDLYVASGNGQAAAKARTLPQNFNQYAWYGNYLILSNGGDRLYVTSAFSDKAPVQISGYLPSQKGYDDAMGGYPGAAFGYDGIY